MILPPANHPQSVASEAQLRPGAHVRHGRNAIGMWFSGKQGGGSFNHPFSVAVFGRSARISRGVIIPEAGMKTVEPVIGGIPISGENGSNAPTLELDYNAVNEDGESWICVEVTPDPTTNRAKEQAGVLDDGSVVEIVQCDAPIITGRSIKGRAPLALLTFRNGRAQAFQIAFFNLRYRLVVPADGKTIWRHYFT
jgi:hypothetical protein